MSLGVHTHTLSLSLSKGYYSLQYTLDRYASPVLPLVAQPKSRTCRSKSPQSSSRCVCACACAWLCPLSLGLFYCLPLSFPHFHSFSSLPSLSHPLSISLHLVPYRNPLTLPLFPIGSLSRSFLFPSHPFLFPLSFSSSSLLSSFLLPSLRLSFFRSFRSLSLFPSLPFLSGFCWLPFYRVRSLTSYPFHVKSGNFPPYFPHAVAPSHLSLQHLSFRKKKKRDLYGLSSLVLYPFFFILYFS